jgi:YD repeat-containing protein
MHHLRSGAEREWAEFGERPEGRELGLTFAASRNSSERTLRLRHRDLKQPWRVALNGEDIARLPLDEADIRTYWRVPAGTLHDGSNALRIYSTAKVSDDVMIGEVALINGTGITTSSRAYDSSTGFTTYAYDLGSGGRSFEPTVQGNVWKSIDGLQKATTLSYAWGVVNGIVTPENVVTTSVVNPNGTIDSTTTGGLKTTFHYDELFRLLWMHLPPQPPQSPPYVQPDGVTYEYDNTNGEWTRTNRGQSVTTQQSLDGFGRVVDVATSPAPFDYIVRTSRDACGRVAFQSAPFRPGGSWTRGVTTTYDALNRVKTVTTPNLTDPDKQVTQYSYNGIDVTITDAEGRQTLYDYSAAGALTRLVGVRDAAQVWTTYQYDISEQLSQVSGPGTTPVRTWVYDGAGRLLYDIQPESGRTDYAHNAANLLTQRTDAMNQVTTYGYDQDQRLRTVDYPGAADDLTIHYDPSTGQLAYQYTGPQSDKNVYTTFTYDVSGRLTARTDSVKGVINPSTSSYAYDGRNNLTRITYPSGREVTYAYDALDRLTTVNQKPPGASLAVPFAHTFNYDNSSRLTGYTTGSGSGTVNHTFAFDDSDRVTRLTAGGSALDLTYTYDRVSNVKTVTDPRPGMNQAFGYDVLNRLASATGPWGSRGWSYNAAGDRIWESAWGSTNYVIDPTTRRLASTTGLFPESFGYNNVGQLTSDSRGTYAYNGPGLLATFSGSGTSATYTYDPSGLRIVRNVNGMKVYTVRSAGSQTLSEYQDACGSGTAVWTRDVIYAGGRLLGAVKATLTEPTVAFTGSPLTTTEQAGTQTVNLQVTTPGGGLTTCPMTVAITAGGTANRNADYTLATNTVTIPTGTANGAMFPISATVKSASNPAMG